MALRYAVLIAAMAAVALTLVHIRAEQTRTAAESARMQRRWVELRQEWWSLQVRTARLKAPGRIHEQVAAKPINLLPPGHGRHLRLAHGE